MTLEIVNLEALRVAPDELLVLRLPKMFSDQKRMAELRDLVPAEYRRRIMIIAHDIEPVVIKEVDRG